MRRPALLLALLLVLVAGTAPAALGILRGFRGDRVTTTDGKTHEGTVVAETQEGVRLVTDRRTLDLARGEVKEVLRGATWTTIHLRGALSDPFHWKVLGWTLLVALLGTLGALAIGLPFAVLTARTDLPGRGLFSSLYAAPLVLPPLLTAMAWDSLLPRGWVEGAGGLGRLGTALQGGALFALAYFPFVTLFARRSLASVGASAEEAAVLAAGPWRALLRVTLPLARPGILLGTLFAFVFCLNDFSVVDYLNIVRPPSRQVSVYPFLLQFNFSRKMGSIEQLLVLGLPLAAVSLAATVAALRIATRSPTATVGSAWRSPRPLRLGPAGGVLGALFCTAVLAAGALVPLLSLAAEAGGPAAYSRVFADGGAAANLRLSLGLAAAAALLAVPAALVLAEAGRRLGAGGEGLLGALAILPLALVPALVPIGAMEMWDRSAFTLTRHGAPWNPVYDTAILPALVVFSRVFPFALAATWASLREIEPSLHEAAEIAAVPWDVRLRRVALPLARPGVVLGGLLAFVFALRELDALAVLGTQTLLRRLWAALHFQRDATVAAMAVALLVSMALAFGLAALSGWLRPRGQEARGGAPAASARRSSTSS